MVTRFGRPPEVRHLLVFRFSEKNDTNVSAL